MRRPAPAARPGEARKIGTTVDENGCSDTTLPASVQVFRPFGTRANGPVPLSVAIDEVLAEAGANFLARTSVNSMWRA